MKTWLKQIFKPKFTTSTTHKPQQGVKVALDELIALEHQAHGVNLLSRQRVMTDRVGGYLSRFKGRGMDFEEVRAYQAGDDIRLMDWRVTARTGKPHTKVFHEERERPIFILVDLSASMFFGTKVAFKSVIAAKIATILAWAAIKNGDRIGGMIYGGEKSYESQPKSRHRGVLPFIKALSTATQNTPLKNEVALEHALVKMRNVIRPGSLVFIISDFAHLNAVSEKQLGLLSRHNEIVFNFIFDPLEKTAPPAGSYSISDGIQQIVMDTNNAQYCQLYRQKFDDRLQKLKEISNRYQIALIPLQTNDPILKVLKKGLSNR